MLGLEAIAEGAIAEIVPWAVALGTGSAMGAASAAGTASAIGWAQQFPTSVTWAVQAPVAPITT